jgi:hypothetical protein
VNVNHQNQKEENVNLNPLTPEALRQFPGLNNLCDQEAQAIIDSLATFAQISYEVFMQQGS